MPQHSLINPSSAGPARRHLIELVAAYIAPRVGEKLTSRRIDRAIRDESLYETDDVRVANCYPMLREGFGWPLHGVNGAIVLEAPVELPLVWPDDIDPFAELEDVE